MHKLTLALCLASLSATCAHATTRLEIPITYMPGASVNEDVKKDCKIEDMLATSVGPMLGKLYKIDNPTVTTGADAGTDPLLRLRITNVLGIGGGAWTGPKNITVLAELLENGQVTQHTKIGQTTVFGGYKGTCGILEGLAKDISKDLNKWVQHPTTDEPEQPKKAAKTTANEAAKEIPATGTDSATKPAETLPAGEQKP